jgi:osmotically-inducible protein OsmY
MADRYDDRFRSERYGERGYGREDRGFAERAGDEVRSWFGDEEAERRRRFDERERERERQRERESGYGRDFGPTGYRSEIDYGTRYGGGYTGTYGGALGGGYSRPYAERYGTGSEAGRRGEFVGRGPKGYKRSDARINEDVCDRLADAPDVDASNIEVLVNNGEVTLSGTVSGREDKRRAEDLIENVSGVREVHNNLRVAR